MPGPTLLTTAFSDNPDYYMDEDASNHAVENVIDDNFDDDVKSKLTEPTDEQTVATAVDGGANIDVVLWRGTSGDKVAKMETEKSAGGDAQDSTIDAPSKASAKTQVAFGKSLPEFTTNKNLGFSFRHWLVVVKVNTRYLTKGSGSEDGWVCNSAAPIEMLEKVDRTLGFPELAFVNAS